MRVLIDGLPADPATASVSVFDWGVVRGDGCFEALRSYDGVAFAVDSHLDRLWNSASVLGMDATLPERDLLASWIADIAAQGGDCVVRVIATRTDAGRGFCSVALGRVPLGARRGEGPVLRSEYGVGQNGQSRRIRQCGAG